MFASTRYFIHQTLYITKEVNWRILTPEERERYEQGDRRELELRFLSFMDERDLFKYARHLDIRTEDDAPPDILEPRLQYFQSLDRIHTLTIYPSMLQRLQHVLRPVLSHLDDTHVLLPHRSPPLHAMAVRFTISQPRESDFRIFIGRKTVIDRDARTFRNHKASSAAWECHWEPREDACFLRSRSNAPIHISRAL